MMEGLRIYFNNLMNLDCFVKITFVWVGIFCLINFHRRKSVSWLMLSLFFWGLLLNKIWRINELLGNWLVVKKYYILEIIDKILPGLDIVHNTSNLLLAIFYILLLIMVIVVIRQIAFRKFCAMLGFSGFVIYFIAICLWGFWAFCSQCNIPVDIIMTFKNTLLTMGNLFFIGSFILAIKR